MNTETLQTMDQQYIWHPFAPMKRWLDTPPLVIERGEGMYLIDTDGNKYLDWMMSYGALPLGHAHPEIIQSITEGVSTGMHFAAATEIELEVAEQLQAIIPNAE